MADTAPIDVDKLAALHDRNRDLNRELGEANILLDGARAALRTANAEIAELRGLAARAVDALANADAAGWDALDALTTSHTGAGCSTSPNDPQSPTTTRGPDMPG